ncbi:TRAP transporter small permease subunit [Magnetospirillum sp. ME-1]|uniref:TRAP transporter small permease subunit n=1 Tax=Magnetospirillum sp. ME-1 TaxID=1639348 RepID=UPI0011AEACA2|nr:TRAP transporter small permease subunit [Magnetospirillum sp. ME-1]
MAGRWLVLPVSLLLLAQWPLRDLIQAGSRQANDAAQALFALYVALALTFASRRHAHLAAASWAESFPPATRRLIGQAGNLLFVTPWALFILVTATPATLQSLGQLEAFPDTYNPGYFLVRLATWGLAALALAQALLQLRRPK